MPSRSLQSALEGPTYRERGNRADFQCVGRYAYRWREHVVNSPRRATCTPFRQHVQSFGRLRRATGSRSRPNGLSAATTAEHSKNHFTYSTDELTAMAEAMLDGDKEGISAQDLLTGLATSEARGLTDSSEQASERRRRFGVNRLPSREEVRNPKHVHCLFRPI